MTKISFVYFDVGGVVIKDFSDSPKWSQLANDLNLTSDQFAMLENIYDEHIHEVAKGNEHVDNVMDHFCELTHLPRLTGFSLQQYFLDHFERNESIWPIIEEVQSKCRTGLLTDMFPGLFEGIKKLNLFPDISWDIVVDSSVVGSRKPMPEIYQLAENKAGVPPQEILFIDNREKNLVPAASRGWQTFFYDSRDYEKSNRDLLQFIHAKFPN